MLSKEIVAIFLSILSKKKKKKDGDLTPHTYETVRRLFPRDQAAGASRPLSRGPWLPGKPGALPRGAAPVLLRGCPWWGRGPRTPVPHTEAQALRAERPRPRGRRGRVAPSSMRLPRRAGTRGSAESKTACVPCQHFRAVPTDTLTPGDTRTPPKEFRGSCGGGAHHGRAPERSF